MSEQEKKGALVIPRNIEKRIKLEKKKKKLKKLNEELVKKTERFRRKEERLSTFIHEEESALNALRQELNELLRIERQETRLLELELEKKRDEIRKIELEIERKRRDMVAVEEEVTREIRRDEDELKRIKDDLQGTILQEKRKLTHIEEEIERLQREMINLRHEIEIEETMPRPEEVAFEENVLGPVYKNIRRELEREFEERASKKSSTESPEKVEVQETVRHRIAVPETTRDEFKKHKRSFFSEILDMLRSRMDKLSVKKKVFHHGDHTSVFLEIHTRRWTPAGDLLIVDLLPDDAVDLEILTPRNVVGKTRESITWKIESIHEKNNHVLGYKIKTSTERLTEPIVKLIKREE